MVSRIVVPTMLIPFAVLIQGPGLTLEGPYTAKFGSKRMEAGDK